MKTCLIVKMAALLLLVVVLAVPASSWAVVHSAQVLGEDPLVPLEGVTVHWSILVDNVWENFEDDTDEDGFAGVDVVPDAGAVSYFIWADDPYDGPDGGEIFYPKFHVLFDETAGGMR